MLSIAHGPTGAFIAKVIPNPFISTPLILLSHYLEDHIPHWDVGQGITNAHKNKTLSFFQELLFDFPFSILLTYLLFQSGKPFDSMIWFGWFVGLLPDFIEFPRLFLNKRLGFLELHHRFHKWFHVSTPNKLWGLLPQIILILFFLLYR